MGSGIDKAVALRFDTKSGDAPGVVAVGRGALARRILELAFDNNVKVREDAELVEILSDLDLGENVPAVAFAVIAEILAHVYRWEAGTRDTIRAGWEKTAAADPEEQASHGA